MFFESIIFILVIIVLIVVIQLKKNMTEKLDFLYLRIEQLSNLLANKESSVESKAETKHSEEQVIHQESFKPFTPYQPQHPVITEPAIVPQETVAPEHLAEPELTPEPIQENSPIEEYAT